MMGQEKYTTLVPEMRRLRALKWTYERIEKHLGIKETHGRTVSSYLNPELRARHSKSTKKWQDAHKELQDALRPGILALYGGKCSECGISISEVLQLNHIHGGHSRERRRRSHYGEYLFTAILEGKENKEDYNLLCANCNVLYEYKCGRKVSPSLEHTSIIRKLGGKCAECGITDMRVLQVNHLNGGGGKEIADYGGHARFYSAILYEERSTDDLNVLCANHNVLFKPVKISPWMTGDESDEEKIEELRRKLDPR